MPVVFYQSVIHGLGFCICQITTILHIFTQSNLVRDNEHARECLENQENQRFMVCLMTFSSRSKLARHRKWLLRHYSVFFQFKSMECNCFLLEVATVVAVFIFGVHPLLKFYANELHSLPSLCSANSLCCFTFYQAAYTFKDWKSYEPLWRSERHLLIVSHFDLLDRAQTTEDWIELILVRSLFCCHFSPWDVCPKDASRFSVTAAKP